MPRSRSINNNNQMLLQHQHHRPSQLQPTSITRLMQPQQQQLHRLSSPPPNNNTHHFPDLRSNHRNLFATTNGIRLGMNASLYIAMDMVSPSRVIWVFDKNKTEYVPLPVSELQQWMGKPVIVVLNCNAAEVLIPFAVKTICAVHPVRHRYSTTIVPSKSLLPPKNEHWLRLY